MNKIDYKSMYPTLNKYYNQTPNQKYGRKSTIIHEFHNPFVSKKITKTARRLINDMINTHNYKYCDTDSMILPKEEKWQK